MEIGRREFLTGTTAAAMAAMTVGGLGGASTLASQQGASPQGASQMYGLIGKMTTVPGQRDAFLAILMEGIHEGMPGCLSYVVAKDPTNENAIWITEVWDSKESHAAALTLPKVREAITKGRPMIAGGDTPTTTEPVGGYGLASAKGAAPAR